MYIIIYSIGNITKKYVYPPYHIYYSSKCKDVNLTDIKLEYYDDIYFEPALIGTSA